MEGGNDVFLLTVPGVHDFPVNRITLRSDWTELKNSIVPYLTASPASLRAFAVPPEAIRSKPTAVRFLANSTRPVLSETLNKAETEDVFPHHSQYKTLSPSRPWRGGDRLGGQSRISRPSRRPTVARPSPGPPGVRHPRAALPPTGRGARSHAAQPGAAIAGSGRRGAGGRGRGSGRAREGLTELAGCHGCGRRSLDRAEAVAATPRAEGRRAARARARADSGARWAAA